MGLGRPSKLRLALAAGIVVLLGAAAVLWWLRAQGPAAFQAHTWVPQGTTELLWTANLDEVAGGVADLAARVPGAVGAREVAELLAGVDLLDVEAISEAGFRVDAGLLAYRWHGAAWVLLPLQSRKGAEHIVDLLRRRGYAPTLQAPASGDVSAQWSFGDRIDPKKEALHAWLRPGALVLRWQPVATTPPEDAAQAWTAWRAAPRVASTFLLSQSGEVHVRAVLSPESELTLGLHNALGLGNLLFGGLVDRFISAQADLTLKARLPSLHLQLRTEPRGAEDVAAFQSGFVTETPGTLLNLGDLLPDETMLLLRARANPALWSMVPSGLRDRALPASFLGVVHPALNGVDARQALIAAFDGQVVGGVLSIADTVPLDPRTWPEVDWRASVSAFASLLMTSDVAAQTFVQQCRTAIETSPDKPTTVQLGLWSGFGVPGPGAPWLLLRKNRSVVLVTGPGAEQDLRRVAKRRFGSLGSAAEGPIEQDLVAGGRFWLGATATTPRALRSLRRRGVPDHFLQMLGSLSASSLAVQLGPDGVDAWLQLRPAPEDGAPAPAGEAR